jgi:hypothetical protein
MSDNQEKLQVEVVEEDKVVEVPVVEAETAEVVKNVKEMLSSTDNKSGNDLENRVKVLEERLEKLIKEILFRHNYPGKVYIKSHKPYKL